ncbi:MAG: hypothetical protein H6838_03420 [Planctomycetes bacterium]|nr:hypothetical protein [Planctomycetota bacterium]MCB9884513.1 hypothetical protein [Planctomycetota bacterium]
MSSRHLPRLLLIVCTFAVAAMAQHAVGTRVVAWPNPTSLGSPVLTARVHYPAVTAGVNAPVLPRSNGWPTVVFLHGFALLGNDYHELGDELARAGFVAVMSNTAQLNNLTQEYDGRALFTAVCLANRCDALSGAFDVGAIGLVGHSMGGGNVANVLANNPGYRCGLSLAPVSPLAGRAALVHVPLGIIAGMGDSTTPLLLNAQPFYQSMTGYRQIKSLHLLSQNCNHNNVAGLLLTTAAHRAVFANARDLGVAFLRRFLLGQAAALEDTIGDHAKSGSQFVALTHEFERPQIWLAGPLRIGSRVRLSMAGEPGIAGTLAAFSQIPSPLPTPVGPLHLDPATTIVGVYSFVGTGRRYDYTMIVPNDPAFVGVSFSLQAFGNGRNGGPILGNAIDLCIER